MASKIICNLLVVLVFFFCLPALGTGQVSGHSTKQSVQVSPEDVQRVVSCLVAARFVQADLRSLGLRIGDKTTVKYHRGAVPGMMPVPGEIHIIVYSASRRDGWLLIAEPNNKSGFTAIQNAYKLHKVGARWKADEGNGGMATYRAMSKLAVMMADSTDYPVELKPSARP
jgi:hypothetical protein